MAPSVAPVSGLSIGKYLIQRLQDYELKDVFGIPGDYILNFYSQLEESPINVVGCTSEACAGFAADAYARINGLGAVCVTYCVGGLSLCNSIAGAYAEKSPVVVIAGSPGLSERTNNPLLHHKVKDFRTQFEVFQKLCVAGTEVLDPETAFTEIDKVLDAITRYKRPGIIELPRDLVNVIPRMPHTPSRTTATGDPAALAEAVSEACRRISEAKRPVILAGVELHRFALQDELLAFAEGAGIPIATTMLGKSVISEVHPLHVGLYEGAMGREEVTRFVEESDLVIMLGAFMTDINLGIYTANLDPLKCIDATSETLRISHHHFHDVLLADFIRGLAAAGLKAPRRTLPSRPSSIGRPFAIEANAPLRIERVVSRINDSLDETMAVVADVGDSLFAATELTIQKRTKFLSPAYYTSMGFGVPAALGVQTAQRDLRPVVFVGDGAFQMTGQELSTIIRRGYNPIVLVLDNAGYGTERFLHPGDHKYNDINPWAYHKLPLVYGGGTGYEVRTEGEFEEALKKALADKKGMSLIQIHLAKGDASRPLRRLAEKLSARV